MDEHQTPDIAIQCPGCTCGFATTNWRMQPDLPIPVVQCPVCGAFLRGKKQLEAAVRPRDALWNRVKNEPHTTEM